MQKEMFEGFMDVLNQHNSMSLSDVSISWEGSIIKIFYKNNRTKVIYRWDEEEKAFVGKMVH